MSYSNGKISAPVGIVDVQKALGSSSSDVGTLCTHQNVNMWAKFKPVRWNNQNTLQALNANKTWNVNTAEDYKWWKAVDGNYGLNFSNAVVNIQFSISGVKDALNAIAVIINTHDILNGWEYRKPRGKMLLDNEFYRLADFNQYNHSAVRPIKSLSTHNVSATSSGEYSVSVDYIESEPSDINIRDYIKPDDIAGTTLYRGIAIYVRKPNLSYDCIGWCTGVDWNGLGIRGTDPQYNPGEGDTKATTILSPGDYYVLPVYFTCQLPQPERNQSLHVQNTGFKVITMPYTQLKSFKAIQSQRIPVLSNKNISMGGNYSATLSLQNTGVTFTSGFTTAIVNENFEGTFASGNYIVSTYQTSSSFPFPFGTTQFASFNLQNGELTSDHTWLVYLNLNGTEYYISLRQPAQQ